MWVNIRGFIGQEIRPQNNSNILSEIIVYKIEDDKHFAGLEIRGRRDGELTYLRVKTILQEYEMLDLVHGYRHTHSPGRVLDRNVRRG